MKKLLAVWMAVCFIVSFYSIRVYAEEEGNGTRLQQEAEQQLQKAPS